MDFEVIAINKFEKIDDKTEHLSGEMKFIKIKCKVQNWKKKPINITVSISHFSQELIHVHVPLNFSHLEDCFI